MLSLFTLSVFVGLGFSIMYALTPLSMGLWIIFMSLFSSLYCSCCLYSWFGLMLFLIYVGGMLVVFAYFLAIEPNQEFKLRGVGAIFMAFFFIILLIGDWSFFSGSISLVWLTAMFSIYNLVIFVSLGLVLFLALLAVVKISLFFMGPLRFFYYV